MLEYNSVKPHSSSLKIKKIFYNSYGKQKKIISERKPNKLEQFNDIKYNESSQKMKEHTNIKVNISLDGVSLTICSEVSLRDFLYFSLFCVLSLSLSLALLGI